MLEPLFVMEEGANRVMCVPMVPDVVGGGVARGCDGVGVVGGTL